MSAEMIGIGRTMAATSGRGGDAGRSPSLEIFASCGCQPFRIYKIVAFRNGTISEANTAPLHPSIANLRIEVKGDAVSTMNSGGSVIQNKHHFGLQRNDQCADGRPISMSATMREQATANCTMFSLQLCILLCE